MRLERFTCYLPAIWSWMSSVMGGFSYKILAFLGEVPTGDYVQKSSEVPTVMSCTYNSIMRVRIPLCITTGFEFMCIPSSSNLMFLWRQNLTLLHLGSELLLGEKCSVVLNGWGIQHIHSIFPILRRCRSQQLKTESQGCDPKSVHWLFSDYVAFNRYDGRR